MRPIARQSVRLAHRQQLRSTSRPRNPRVQQSRGISVSSPKLSEPRPPNGPSEDHSHLGKQKEEQRTVAGEGALSEQTEDNEAKAQAETRRPGLRKTLRQRRQSDTPKPPPLPDWFVKYNVDLRVDGPTPGSSSWTQRTLRYIDKDTGHTLFTLPYFPTPKPSTKPESPREERPEAVDGSKPAGDEKTQLSRTPEDSPHRSDASDQPQPPTSSDQIGQNFFGYMFGNGAKASAKEADSVQEKSANTKTHVEKVQPDVQQQSENKVESPQPGEKQNVDQGTSEKKQQGRNPKIEHAWNILEIEAAARAAMTLSQGNDSSSSFAASRVDLSLHCPDSNAHYQLDMLVRCLATILHADVVRLDANDFADLTSDYVGQSHDSPGSFSTLGYDVFDGYQANTMGGSMKPPPTDPDSQDQDMDEPDEDADPNAKPDIQGINLGHFSNMEELRKVLHEKRHELSKALGGIAAGISVGTPKVISPSSTPSTGPQQQSANKPSASSGEYVQWDDQRLGTLLDTLVDAGKNKRVKVAFHDKLPGPIEHRHWRLFASSLLNETLQHTILGKPESQLQCVDGGATATHEDNAKFDSKQRTIIHVRDLKDIRNSRLGDAIVRRLVRVVQKRRRNGEEVMIIGTTAQDPIGPPDTLIDDAEDSPFRGLVVQPKWASLFTRPLPREGLFAPVVDDHASGGGYSRIFEINARHIDSMLRRLAPSSDLMLSKDRSAQKLVGLSGFGFLRETVLSLDDVQRLVLIAIGLAQTHVVADKLEAYHIGLARVIMTRSDRFLREWEPVRIAPSLDAAFGTDSKPEDGGEQPKTGKARIDELKKNCNAHETKLLSGVKDAENIATAFADVHAAKETIDSLKTLTSLSLLRPDAFKYGVLAKDRLPGLLLYGPPGTGKTLLAKAVAKESRATVLEVSGAQIYEKYVGEGEKMVNAVFTLAKKLSPCVVFIDEADALFGARSSSGNRNTHREIINQFLRGWDGMDDHGVFMMVATNRPFDLDDAVLRRLPRRLLVDLPMAKDRQSILSIHLSSEALAPSVDLAKLSEQTPFYSGSDLKNLCVSAALAAVREENDVAEANKSDPDFKLPEKRTLESKHFEKAMAEVSASISEDMSSLKAVRKFDEQYGDRRERRKKSTYGFGVTPEGGVADESAARVRQGTPSPRP